MSREILVILGSPRKGGNSEQMADAFIRGAERAGHRISKIYTEDLNTGCVGCGGCYQNEETPCCRNSDFNGTAAAFLRADGVVFASPLYWYDIPGKLKCYIDNLFCFFAAGKDMGRKRTAMLCCGHAVDYAMFDGVQRTYELIAKCLDWSIAEQIYVPGVYEAGEIQKTDALKRCEALGEHFFE